MHKWKCTKQARIKNKLRKKCKIIFMVYATIIHDKEGLIFSNLESSDSYYLLSNIVILIYMLTYIFNFIRLFPTIEND